MISFILEDNIRTNNIGRFNMSHNDVQYNVSNNDYYVDNNYDTDTEERDDD